LTVQASFQPVLNLLQGGDRIQVSNPPDHQRGLATHIDGRVRVRQDIG
jgi:hypothetical protein